MYNYPDEAGLLQILTDVYGTIEAAKPTAYTVTVAASDWTSNAAGGYYCTKTVAGIKASDNPVADVVLSTTYSTAVAQLDAWCDVLDGNIITTTNSVTLYCYTAKPTVSLTIRLVVL